MCLPLNVRNVVTHVWFAEGRPSSTSNLPVLIEKITIDNAVLHIVLSGNVDIQDGPVRQLGCLSRVALIPVEGEREAAVQHDVSCGVERIRVNQDRNVLAGRVAFPTNRNAPGIPSPPASTEGT